VLLPRPSFLEARQKFGRSGGRRAKGRARDAEKQADKLCKDERAQTAVARALAHSFWSQGCEPDRLVAPEK
jgi:hypothetical protein